MTRRLAALGAGLMLLVAACTARDESSPQPPARAGGTLELGLVADLPGGLDPQKAYYPAAWELFRCCLLRAPMSFPGKPAGRGGSFPAPDLAREPPTVSEDGLLWTFRLREGIRYAPPYDSLPIIARDVIRGLERAADPATSAAGYSFLYSVIQGFDEFSRGEASRISGMRARGEHTLEVRLTRPAGDLGYLMALPAAAPIPPRAADEVADYAGLLAASGPYMLAGSDSVDLDAPVGERRAAQGYRPGRRIVLVRNPSWDRETDPLRPALPDRIRISIGGEPDELAERVVAGSMDMVLDAPPPRRLVQEHLRDPGRADRVFRHRTSAFDYVALNPAVPPFDDVRVRRAVNLVVDKTAVRRALGGSLAGDYLDHVMPDPMVADRLVGFDPYPTPGHQGDVEEAMSRVAESRYDRDGDGLCDGAACKRLPLLVAASPSAQAAAEELRANLQELNIRVQVESVEPSELLRTLSAHQTPFAMAIPPTWRSDFPDGGTVARSLLAGAAIGPEGCCNISLLGATPEQVSGLGYGESAVPSFDEEIGDCEPLVGEDRAVCWAGVDRLISRRGVPWIPLQVRTRVDLVSERVTAYSFDQMTGLAAVDHLAVA